MLSRVSKRLYSKGVPRIADMNPEYIDSLQRFKDNALLRSSFPKGTPDHAIELWSQWPDNVPAPGQEITKEYLDKKYPAPKPPKFHIWGGLIGFPVTDPVKFRYQMLTQFEERSRHFFTHFVKNNHKSDFNVVGGDKKYQFFQMLSWACLVGAFIIFIPMLITITVFNRTYLYQNVIKGSAFDMRPSQPYKKVRRDETGRYYIGK
mmetsp:Transcript_4631/g.17459  ORF Transcript_4631/g.17459 Transcript_4631/m.17459 type:complete len:205 (+) Transcript_4631:67-681(+)